LFTSAIIFENCILDNFFSQEQLYIYIRVWQKMLGYILCNFFAKSSGHPNWALRKTKNLPCQTAHKEATQGRGTLRNVDNFFKKAQNFNFPASYQNLPILLRCLNISPPGTKSITIYKFELSCNENVPTPFLYLFRN
jgi:hypothetical protein